MILIIDNYDSFTYNLYQCIEEIGFRCEVRRNDQINLEQIKELRPEKIVISPGPDDPDAAGVTLETISTFAGQIPILGVCLGHQAIGQAFGAKVIRAPRPRHGKSSQIRHDGKGVYQGLANPFSAARYHSLVISEATLPSCLEVSARTDDGLIMGVRHRHYCVEGVQFHPESIATQSGRELLKNFLLLQGDLADKATRAETQVEKGVANAIASTAASA